MENNYVNESLTIMSIHNFIWGLIGIVFGLIINKLSKKISDHFRINNKNIKILLQLVICSIALGYVHKTVNEKYRWMWQTITPELFFISFFFGVQYMEFSAIEDLYA